MQKLQSRGRKTFVYVQMEYQFTLWDRVKSSVYSHFAMQTTDMPAELVVARASAMPHCIAKIKAADTMRQSGNVGQGVFGLVNAIHHEIAEDNDKNKPFTSKQIVFEVNYYSSDQFQALSMMVSLCFHHTYLGWQFLTGLK